MQIKFVYECFREIWHIIDLYFCVHTFRLMILSTFHTRSAQKTVFHKPNNEFQQQNIFQIKKNSEITARDLC